MSDGGEHGAISDEELMAFVDGELVPERSRAVEAFLSSSPVAAEQVEIWRQQAQALREALARVESEPPPPSVLLPYRKRGADRVGGAPKTAANPAGRPRRGAGGKALIGAFLAGVLAALGGVYLANPQRWTVAPFAGRQESPAGGPRSAEPAPTPSGGDSTSAAGSGVLIVPNLSRIGYRLVGARTAAATSALRGAAPFCLFYAHPSEASLTLCAAPEAAPSAGFDFGERNGPGGATVIWSQAGARYTLTAAADEAKLRKLAAATRAAIADFDAR